MKRMIVLILALCFTLTSWAGVRIISDLDDTVKITHAANPIRMTYHGLFSKRVFAGMPTLYQYMNDKASELVILTASPNPLKKKIARTLNKHQIPFDFIIAKKIGKDSKSTFDYKYSHIEKQFMSNNDQYILLGDDVSHDPEIYEAIKEAFPGRVLDIYIRSMRGRDIPAGQIKFISAYDVARNEYFKGRLSLFELKDVGYEVSSEPKDHNIIPKYFHCPSSGTIHNGPIADQDSEDAVKFVISTICN
jgi:hypothetical protein